jgi:hypothetical protein
MRHSKIGRILAVAASACLLFALGCGLLGLAVQQRVITLTDINLELGSFSIVMRAPRSSICPERTDPLANLCDRFSSVRGPVFYRIWLFVSTPERGPRSTRVLLHWALPVHDQAHS